ncbi:MAG: Bis(5'-nucleosyl)-tetraphosphatase PrpE (asymmetrical) [Chlorobi bacterium OLB7]|nr:MAG: Bis(5'-nucleosyl)-tetraphosphatase PrpE (asymmetrical) [Chlorobi bacterium OLB7]
MRLRPCSLSFGMTDVPQLPDGVARGFHDRRVHRHLSLRSADVIGDVHGCFDELAELITQLGHAELLRSDLPPALAGAKPRLMFVGDIVDRGDQIVETVRLVERLCRGGHALMVMGNHDYRFLRWLHGRDVEPQHGLEMSIEQFRRLPHDQFQQWRSKLIEFFESLPWAIRFDGGRGVVVHAAWHAELLHDHVSEEHFRRYALHGPVTGKKRPDGLPDRIDWASKYSGPEFVVFGHQVYPEPYRQQHAIGIDTGCVFGGALTGLRYPAMEAISVPSKRVRYKR